MRWSQMRLTRSVCSYLARLRPLQPRSRSARVHVEQLEDRCLPAVITPTTFNDGLGIGSLRDAIIQANSNAQNNAIDLAAGTYNLSLTGRGETAGKSGDLDLTATGFTETRAPVLG
jgi:hypothetical protein